MNHILKVFNKKLIDFEVLGRIINKIIQIFFYFIIITQSENSISL